MADEKKTSLVIYANPSKLNFILIVLLLVVNEFYKISNFVTEFTELSQKLKIIDIHSCRSKTNLQEDLVFCENTLG